MGMSTGLKTKVLDTGFQDSFDGADGDLLDFRTGAIPSDADQAITGTQLLTIAPPSDAFAAPALGSVSKQGTWSGAGLAAAGSGTNIGYARLKTSGDGNGLSTTDKRQDFTVGTAGANIAITGAAVVAGQTEFTVTAHGLSNGDMVEITGHSVAFYNRKWVVNSIAANTFRVGSAVTPGSGGNSRKSYEITVDNINVAQAQVLTVNTLTIALS